MKIAAAYIRVSTDDQTEYSPDSQIKAIREYAKRNEYVLPEENIYIDEGISGRHAEKRPAFNKMIKVAKTEPAPFEAILLWKYSRFARNREDAIVYKSMLRNKHGISVISITESVDDDKMSILVEAMIEAMDEYYSVNLAEEVRRGMNEKASRGEAMGVAAFGYDLKNKTYVPNKDAIIVSQIFEAYLNGTGTRAIAVELGKYGVRTARGNPPDNRFIEYILRNPVYAGKIRWSTYGKAASKRDYDNPNIVVVQGHHEPIIDEKTFNNVQTKLNETKSHYRRYQRPEQTTDWMLKGLVRCSDCGSTLIKTSTNEPSMQCHSYAKGKCHFSHNISINKANKIVIDELRRCTISMDFNLTPKEQKQKDDSLNLNKLLESEQNKLKKIKDAYQSGVDTLNEYKENKARIIENIEQIRTVLNERRKKETSVFDKQAYAKKVSAVLITVTDDTVSEQAKSIALRTIISKIVFSRSENRLFLFFYS